MEIDLPRRTINIPRSSIIRFVVQELEHCKINTEGFTFIIQKNSIIILFS